MHAPHRLQGSSYESERIIPELAKARNKIAVTFWNINQPSFLDLNCDLQFFHRRTLFLGRNFPTHVAVWEQYGGPSLLSQNNNTLIWLVLFIIFSYIYIFKKIIFYYFFKKINFLFGCIFFSYFFTFLFFNFNFFHLKSFRNFYFKNRFYFF